MESFGACQDHLLVVTRVTFFNRWLDRKNFLRPRNVKHSKREGEGETFGRTYMNGPEEKMSTFILHMAHYNTVTYLRGFKFTNTV